MRSTEVTCSRDSTSAGAVRRFRRALTAFPTGAEFSAAVQNALAACVQKLANARADKCLIDLMKTEYELFRLVERQLCMPEVLRWYKDIDDFLGVANRITNRRKSRAGRSLENHVEFLLSAAGVPFEIRPNIDGRPDVIIPSRDAYEDPSYIGPLYMMVGIKTTCKDRWRQVLNEATKLPQKHLLTMQEGISNNQLAEMKKAQVTLIVPTPLHSRYPKDRPMPLLGVETFIDGVLKEFN